MTTNDQLTGSGISFNFRYVGNIQVATSMRALEFDVRTNLTKECMYRVCAEAGLISERATDSLDSILCDDARIELVGVCVDFIISTRALTVVHADRTRMEDMSTLLLMHPLPNVSFASAGDVDMSDYVCYVAKDDARDRRCFVYECGQKMAVRVLKTIGDAFNKRHDESTLSKSIPIESSPSKPTIEYVNDSIVSEHYDTNTTMKTTSTALPSKSSSVDILSRELWYHCQLNRDDAQRLLRHDGDFLVRQSTKDLGQFVLTGMQNGNAKHLLLIDDKGKVIDGVWNVNGTHVAFEYNLALVFRYGPRTANFKTSLI